MQSVRILDMPPCRMVSSGTGMFGEGRLERFSAWFSGLPRTMDSRDFLFWDGSGLCWLYLYAPGMDVPDAFEIVDFAGGLYAVATDIDQRTDVGAMKKEVDAFLHASGFERDPSRFELGNIITSPRAYQTLGYHQMDYYAPIRERDK